MLRRLPRAMAYALSIQEAVAEAKHSEIHRNHACKECYFKLSIGIGSYTARGCAFGTLK